MKVIGCTMNYIDYKSVVDKELNLDKAFLCSYDDGTNEYCMDVIWYMLQNLKSPIWNNYRFRLLFKVARIVLIIPHSNAGIESVFLLVNKNKSENSNRNPLDIERSLSSRLAVKLDCLES